MIPWLLGVFALTAGCGSSPSSPSAHAATVRRVVVLGDSLSVSPSIAQAFPAQLQTMIDRNALPWTVTNAGISGDTTAGGARRVQSVLGADVGVLIVELGANDGLSGVDTRDIERNLSSIVEVANARNISVLLCGMETLPTRGFDYVLAFHQVFANVAQRYRIPLIPFLQWGVALVPDLNGSNGIHPNAAGARHIAESVWPYLDRVLRERNLTTTVSSGASTNPSSLDLRL
jgi:acyl-CoA thioesterase-1